MVPHAHVASEPCRENGKPAALTCNTLMSYSMTMRTTIYLDDHLAARFKQAAKSKGISLSAFLAESGRAALDAPAAPPEPFTLVTYGSGGVNPGISLDRTSELLAAEDCERYGAGD